MDSASLESDPTSIASRVVDDELLEALAEIVHVAACTRGHRSRVARRPSPSRRT